MFGFLFDLNDKEIKRLQPLVADIGALEETVEKLTKEQIGSRINELKKEIQSEISDLLGAADEEAEQSSDEEIEHWERDRIKRVEREVLDKYVVEVSALVREATKRTIKQRPFDVQILGGIVLHQGKIAEMKTGEGKTLVTTIPAVINALTGKGVHVITVNDYLSKRNTAWMGKIYDYLGLSVSVICHEESLLFDPAKKKQIEKELASQAEEQGMVYSSDDTPLVPISRKEAYDADITYGTNNEFGFDYLRDNMAQDKTQVVQRELSYAIVDEVDSILIDEARTPLIISAPAAESTDQYRRFASVVTHLETEKHYTVDEKMKVVTLTDEGITKVEEVLKIDNIYQSGGVMLVHHLEEALKAQILFQRDKDYVVKDGEVVIVDEFTGRMMPGRRYSEGLHQAIEAKEKVEVKQESLTLATVSFQNLFRLYNKLSGMTGTAATEAEEFHKIYKLDVVEIPTNRPNKRDDLPDQIFRTENGKFNAVAADIAERNKKGQPVLVGTVSIEKNEALSELLKRNGIKHELLNAKNHEKEAHIISKAGHKGAVTVATNMAGRGTDIILDEESVKLGGLHVIGTERHESRRIDNQLRGRTARQGDPGSSQFYVSTEDDLMRIFGGDRLKNIMSMLKVPEDQPIEHKMINRALESAQKKVEGHNFDIRKHLVEYDDVMNKHREVIYRRRRRVLLGDAEGKMANISEDIMATLENRVRNTLNFHIDSGAELSKAKEELQKVIGVNLDDAEPTLESMMKVIRESYEAREKAIGSETMRMVERAIYLRSIDSLWIEHLTNMEHLREGIGLRGYGQYDPLVAYKQESFRMFGELLNSVDSLVAETIFRVELVQQPSVMPKDMIETGSDDSTGGVKSSALKGNAIAKDKTDFDRKATKVQQMMSAETTSREVTKSEKKKVGRNDPCPCGAKKSDGSPVKYKHCHGK